MLKEIHRLSEEDATKVRKWLRGSGGRAYVLVHPYIVPASPAEGRTGAKRDYSWIFFSKRDMTPVFLFEEKDRLTPEKMHRINLVINFYGEREHIRELFPGDEPYATPSHEVSRMRPIILVPTEKDSPHPSEEDWSSLTDRMRKLGAEKLLVFGRFLEKFDRPEVKEAINALADERPALASHLEQELRRDEQAAAIEKERREKSLEKYAPKLAKKGLLPREVRANIEGRRKKIMERTRTGYKRCVGEAYRQFLLYPKKFKSVRLLEMYSTPWKAWEEPLKPRPITGKEKNAKNPGRLSPTSKERRFRSD
ncbi:MAG: hypothetical protein NTY90_00605 [Candidatus Micrarchaeota archaeon]|nr:hypothetical protein [Candidatus Micrarchaeota archaeon]